MPNGDVAAGSQLLLDGRAHRCLARGCLARVGNGLLIIDVATQRLHLRQGPDGHIGSPTADVIDDLIRSGRAILLAPAASAPRPSPIDRMESEVALLDEAGVRTGEKAIWIWLKGNWTDAMKERFGEHDHPATIRKWRSAIVKGRR